MMAVSCGSLAGAQRAAAAAVATHLNFGLSRGLPGSKLEELVRDANSGAGRRLSFTYRPKPNIPSLSLKSGGIAVVEAGECQPKSTNIRVCDVRLQKCVGGMMHRKRCARGFFKCILSFGGRWELRGGSATGSVDVDSADCPTFRPETYLLCASSATSATTSATQLPPHFHHKVRHFLHNFFRHFIHTFRLLPAVAEVAEAVAEGLESLSSAKVAKPTVGCRRKWRRQWRTWRFWRRAGAEFRHGETGSRLAKVAELGGVGAYR
jgi:hypothetical protein